MKIAIVLPRNFPFDAAKPNSIETVVRTFARLAPAGIKLAVFCDAGPGSDGDMATVRVDPAGGRRVRNRRMVQALRDWQPDLVEVHQHVHTARQIARGVRGIPVILYRHNSLARTGKRFHHLRHWFRYGAMKRIVVVSEFLKREFADMVPSLAHRAVVVTNAIDPAIWFAPVEDRERLIAYGGRAAPEKGFAELCVALDDILTRYPQWSAHICGWEWMHNRDFAEACVAPLHAHGTRFVLQTDQGPAAVSAMLKRAAIAVVPSIVSEAFGLAALEAHVAGAAVVSSGRGGLREVGGEHAVYIDAVTAETIIGAVEGLVEDENRRDRLARDGQRHCVEHHQVSVIAERLNAVRRAAVDGTT